MRIGRKPSAIYRTALSCLISFSLGFSPVALAEGNSPKVPTASSSTKSTDGLQNQIYNLLKHTNTPRAKTVGDWFKVAKKYMHPEVAEQIAIWVNANKNQPMPKIEATASKRGGKNSVRLVIKDNGKILPVDIYQEDHETYIEFGGKRYSYNDLYYSDMLKQTFPKPILSVLSGEEFLTLAANSPEQAGNYMARMRGIVNAMETYSDTFYPAESNKTTSDSRNFIDLLIEKSFALADGKSCLVGGNVTVQKNGRCGGSDSNITKACGVSAQVPCNPTIYGYASPNKVICVSRDPATSVSPNCSKKYPVDTKENQDALILNVVGKGDSNSEMVKKFKEGKLSDPEKQKIAADFHQGLQAEIVKAGEVCGVTSEEINARFDSTATANSRQGATRTQKAYQSGDFTKNFPVQKVGSKDINEHHRTACETTLNRIFKAKFDVACATQVIADAAPKPGASDPVEKALKPAELGDSSPASSPVVAAKAENKCPAPIAAAEDVAPPAASPRPDPATGPLAAAELGSATPPQAAAPAGISEQSSNGLRDPNLGGADRKREKPESKACFGIGSIWPCVIGAAALVCVLWLCKDKKEKTATVFVPTPPPMPGKPGETENTRPATTTRPTFVR